MSYDEALAERVRSIIGVRAGVTEKRMFGGAGWMLDDHMAVGVTSTGELMVRIDPDELERALAEPGVRPFEMSGRPMRGWLLVDADAIADDAALARWVDAGSEYAASLPPKDPKGR
jgi:TfoX/Sxy family transcriptional regulator of competence genes